MSDVVDDSSPATIRAAIRRVNQTPGLRIRPGTRALWRIFKAPGHSLSLAELEPEFKALALHFGWFCRRVAEELGEENPREFSLTNKSRDHNGILVLTLKPSVVIAMNG